MTILPLPRQSIKHLTTDVFHINGITAKTQLWRNLKEEKTTKTWIGSGLLSTSASGCFWWTETSSSVSDWLWSVCVPQLCVFVPAQSRYSSFTSTACLRFCVNIHGPKDVPVLTVMAAPLASDWSLLGMLWRWGCFFFFRRLVQQLLLRGRLFGLVCHSVRGRSSVCRFYWAVMRFLWPSNSCERSTFVTRQWALVSSVQWAEKLWLFIKNVCYKISTSCAFESI